MTLYARVAGAWVPVNGTGIDEVFVGPNDPITASPTLELWYDTDDEPAAVDSANYWNSSWGLVAKGALNGISNDTLLAVGMEITTRLSYVLSSSRRYQLKFQIGVYGGAFVAQIHSGGADTGTGVWFTGAAGTWGTEQFEWTINGNGVDQGYSIKVTSMSGTPHATLAGGLWELWDVGPITKAAVNPPDGQPTVATAGNALGVVAVGSTVSPNPTIPTATYGNITNSLSCFFAAGRRYRINVSIRAANLPSPQNFIVRYSLDSAVYGERIYYYSGTWTHFVESWILDGDNQMHGVTVQMRSDYGPVTVYCEPGVSQFYVEDLGPTSAPALPLPQIYQGWTPASLQNGWVNYNGTYQTAQYRKVGDIVTVRGLIAGGSANVTIMVLPAGFRPPADLIFAGDMNSNAHARIDVRSDGTVISSNAVPQYLSLSTINFSVTP